MAATKVWVTNRPRRETESGRGMSALAHLDELCYPLKYQLVCALPWLLGPLDEPVMVVEVRVS